MSQTELHFGFFSDEGGLRPAALEKFLDTSFFELVKAFGYTSDQIEKDIKVEALIVAKLYELAHTIEDVAEILAGESHETKLWFNVSNRDFNGSSPRDLILAGRYKEVYEFVSQAKRAIEDKKNTENP